MDIKKIRSGIETYWLTTVYAILSFVVLDQLLAYRLATLVHGSSVHELSALGVDQTLGLLLKNPTNAIYRLPMISLNFFDRLNVYHVRLLSTVFALLTVLLTYYILRRWQGMRTAIIGSALLVTSSWFLTYARTATSDIIYPFLITVGIAYGTWSRRTKNNNRVLVLGTLVVISFIYTPGLIYFVIPGIIWQRKTLSKQIQDSPTAAIVSMILLFVFVIPLAFAVFKQPELINTLFIFSSNILSTPSKLYSNLISSLKVLIINGQPDPSLGVAGMSMVDLFTGSMAALGAYMLAIDNRLDRAKMILGYLFVSTLIISIGGPDKLVIMLPVIYILASLGISYMIVSWLEVFPRNPLARYVGIGIVCAVVGLTCIYHLDRYFVAWPNSPDTIKAFHLTRVK